VDKAEREALWARWMCAATAGDESAYQQLLEALAGQLRLSVRYRFARMGSGDLDVEDVVQETLLAIHLKRHTWRSTEPIAPWVAAISRNKLVDVLRRRGRRAEMPLDDIPEAALAEQHESEAAGHDVARVLGTLDERQRNIVRLVSIEGHSARSAAEQLGMTEGALRVALHRSLKALASRLRGQEA
jgi:RNA polymerase sigma-70 factor (ECF subfamily)